MVIWISAKIKPSIGRYLVDRVTLKNGEKEYWVDIMYFNGVSWVSHPAFWGETHANVVAYQNLPEPFKFEE